MTRIVVKVGSNVLTRDNGRLDITRMSSIVDQIAWLREHGHEVILVSSGSITSGRDELKVSHKLDSVEQRQLFSAVGQTILIHSYYGFFKRHNINVGQVLTMKESFSTRREYLNQRACMSVMLENGVLPIVNENDTVSVTELMFTDNDELSGLIASMMDADMLIILSNIDGIYNGNPSDPESEVIRRVDLNSDISKFIGTEKSGFGRGGMITKYNIARKTAAEGIKVIIANGKRKDILIDLISSPATTVHTEFIAAENAVSTMKKWIANSSSFSKGIVKINKKAVEAIKGEKAVSLLLVGVTDIVGDFEEGDIITVTDESGMRIAVGRSSYNSEDAIAMIGMHDKKPIVHYDYLYIG